MTAPRGQSAVDGEASIAPTGPLLVFGGPYSNLQATQAVRAEAERRGIPPANVVCTGDVVAYCGQPNETVALLRDWGAHVVMGNCEESLAEGAEDCGCGFEAGSACDLLSAGWYRFARARLEDSHRRWMGGLPRRLRLRYAGLDLAVVHGGVDAINRFVFRSTPETEKTAQLLQAGADGVVGGHSGIPFSQVVGGRLWHNAGVVGMPANDGTPRGWFALWDEDGDGGLGIDIEPLHYDAAAARAAMVDAGLANGYAEALTSGLWPSLDVLPEAERAATGRPLPAQRLLFRAGMARAEPA